MKHGCAKLEEVAEIITGYSFRKSIEPDPNGQIFVVQAKDIVNGEIIQSTEKLTRILEEPNHPAYLQRDDLLLLSKVYPGAQFRTTIYQGLSGKVLASSSIHVIRLKNDSVLPEYLFMLFSSGFTQKWLQENSSGVNTPTMPRATLGTLTIPIISIEQQKAYISLSKEMKNMQRLLQEKADLIAIVQEQTLVSLITS